MQIDDIEITTGVNAFQSASFENHDRTIEYETSKNLSYSDVISIKKGLDVVSEFYDVNAIAATTPIGICAVSLGKTLDEAVTNVMDSNPIDFISATIISSKEIDSDIAKMLKNTNIIAAPSFTKNAIEFMETHNICYITVKTPLKDYKKYLSNETIETPMGRLIQSPNLSELNQDSFKVVTKTKPTVEQIEDAVFAWKVAKHVQSRAIVVAKDLKTTAIAQGLQSASVEFALDYSCDMSKEAILASDLPLTVHDINVAAQGRIGLVILPSVSKDIVIAADKFNMGIITTGFTNILY
ncbi:hypothetical protein IKQ21_04005 [bacterium]|nr:hypothetical protein [bacterium]